jgi:hypothetical protein
MEILVERCFHVIHYYSMGNYKNQVFIGERFSVLTWYLDKSAGAMFTVAEMLSSNQDVQEDMITVAEVERFVRMLADAKSTEDACKFYKLLIAICTCDGKGIESNQTLLSSILFHKSTDLIYKLQQSNGVVEVVPAAKDLLLEFKDFDTDGDGFISPSELRQGMSQLGKEATDAEIAQVFTHFDANSDGEISYEEFVRGSPPNLPLGHLVGTPAHVNMFAAQVSLFAAMCSDRNYIVMQMLQGRFPYDLLLKAIPLSPLPLRSAFLQLVANLYVNSKPQERFKNQLAFKWAKIDSDLPKPNVAALVMTPGVGSRSLGPTMPVKSDQLMFKDLKGMISKELETSAGWEWNAFQLEMVKMLKMLVAFKFYNTIEDLRGIMSPLMNLLDQLNAPQWSEEALSAAKAGRKVIPDIGEEGTVSSAKHPRKTAAAAEQDERREKVLTFLDSIPMMVFVLGLVFYSILASQIEGDNMPRDIVVFVIFAIEMVLRMWAMNSRSNYLADPYAVMDLVVVLLDVFTFAAASVLGAVGGFTKVLRVVRMVRLVRLVRAARLAKAVYGLGKAQILYPWDPPGRYANTSKEKLETMRQVTTGLQTVLLMRNNWGLSLFVSRIREWATVPATHEQGDNVILDLFAGVVKQSDKLGLDNSSSRVQDILSDLCMYEDTSLVRDTLKLLILHSHPYKLMMNELQEVQLMVTETEEVLLDELRNNFSRLQILIESYEVWAGLEDKASIEKSEQVMGILDDLTDACRLPTDKLLMSRGSFVSNIDTQKLMLRLGGFDVMMKAVSCFSNEDSNFDVDALEITLQEDNADNISRILNKTLELLAWFVSDNKQHQEIVYQHLDVFERLASSNSGATLVMVEIFRDNFELLKRVPAYLITDTIKFILVNGRKSQYLALLDVLTHIGNFGIRKNQVLIVNELTKPEYRSKVLFLPEAPGSPAYIERLELMQQVQGSASVVRNAMPQQDTVLEGDDEDSDADSDTLDDSKSGDSKSDERNQRRASSRQAGYGISDDDHLPPELQYHTKLLLTLSGCAAGEINIVEAKVQSLCEYENVIHGLLDPHTIVEVKIALARFLFDVVIDTEIKLDSLCGNELMWKFIQTWPEAIKHAIDALGSLRAARVESELLGSMSYHRRSLVCYCFEAIVPSIDFFFLNYFDKDRLPMPRPEAMALLVKLAISLEELHGASGGLLLPEHELMLHSAFNRLRSLGNLSSTLESLQNLGHIQTPSSKSLAKAMHSRKMTALVPADTLKLSNDGNTAYVESTQQSRDIVVRAGGGDNHESSLSGYFQVVSKDNSTNGSSVRMTYKKAVQLIATEPEVVRLLEEEKTDLIAYLKRLPRRGEAGKGLDVRFEPLLERLVAHMRKCITSSTAEEIERSGGARQLAAMAGDDDEIALFLVELFREMIEFEWGFTIAERDDEGDERSDEKVRALQDAFDASGVTALCLQLVSANVTPKLMMAAVRLLVALLYREGGNKIVQKTISSTLSNSSDAGVLVASQDFLSAMRDSVHAITLWHVTDATELPATKEGDEPEEHGSMIATRLLQLMCEGHYEPNQDLMRGDGKSQFNLLVTFVAHLRELEKIFTRVATHSMIAVLGTTLEVVQGPCLGNQMYLAMESEVLEILNRLVRRKIVAGSDQMDEEEDELKKTVILIFKALLEGQAKPSIIYDRVLSVLHLEVLQLLAMPRSLEDSKLNDMQIQTMVLLQMLTEYQPSLRESLQLHVPRDQVASVEVVWEGDLQRKFFPVPEKIRFLSKQARDTVVEHVDRTSAELKLLDFIDRCMDLHVEMQHQESLDELGLQWLFSRKHQNASTWIAFGLACVVNSIIFTFYEYPGGSEEPMIQDELVRDALFTLNVLQVAFSIFTLVFFIVVRVPVIFKLSYERRQRGLIQSVLTTISDGLTVYYFLYVVVCLLVINVNFIFASILLLDIVIKNSTTRDVLRAVYKPARQLTATAILTFFVVYIFAFVLFIEFRGDFQDGVNDGLCDTLGRCTLMTGNFGLRRTGGVGEQIGMTREDLSVRALVDWLYFIIVLVVLLNVVFGIVIDTFGEIRTSKLDRTRATQNFCFVCDLEKYKFNELAASIQGFKRHIEAEHNMWHYLAFMIFLWEQDQDDDDGLELYVRQLLLERDLSWFPMNTSLVYKSQYGNQKKGEDEIKYQINTLSKKVDDQIKDIKGGLEHLTDTVSAIAKAVGTSSHAHIHTGDKKRAPGI